MFGFIYVRVQLIHIINFAWVLKFESESMVPFSQCVLQMRHMSHHQVHAFHWYGINTIFIFPRQNSWITGTTSGNAWLFLVIKDLLAGYWLNGILFVLVPPFYQAFNLSFLKFFYIQPRNFKYLFWPQQWIPSFTLLTIFNSVINLNLFIIS